MTGKTGTTPERETHDHAGINDMTDAGVCRATGATPRALPSVAALAFLGDAVRAGLDMEFVYRVLRKEI